VSFNYLGQFDQVFVESKLFAIRQDFDGPIRSPLGKRSHLLEINAAVIAGQLHTVWIYSEGTHERATIERLSDAFNATLRSLIMYGAEPGAADTYTPTDFPLAEIDEQELGKLSLLLEEVDG
jgi:non-ribosomal peptide synthase protein (TIGR01720 family)